LNSVSAIAHFSDFRFFINGSLWMRVADEDDAHGGGKWGIAICCDESSGYFGKVMQYKRKRPLTAARLQDVTSRTWPEWLLHVLEKKHLYEKIR